MSETIEIKLVDEPPIGDGADPRPEDQARPTPTPAPEPAKPEPVKPDSEKPENASRKSGFESAEDVRKGIAERQAARDAARREARDAKPDPKPEPKPDKPAAEKTESTPSKHQTWQSAADMRREIAERQAARDAERERQRKKQPRRDENDPSETMEKAETAVGKFAEAIGSGTRKIEGYFAGLIAGAALFFRRRQEQQPATQKEASKPPRWFRQARVATKRAFRPLRAETKRLADTLKKHGGEVSNAMSKTRVGRAVLGVGRRAAGAVGRVGAAAARFIPLTAAGGGGAAATGAVGAAGAAGGAAAGMMALLGPLAALLLVLAGTVIAVRSFGDFFAAQAADLEEFSGAIAGVRAEIESERLDSKIDRAEKIGPAVARVNAAQGRLEEASYEVWTSIYELLSKSAPAIEAIADTATAGVRGIDMIIQTAEYYMAWAMNKPAVDQVSKAADVVFAGNQLTKAFEDIFKEHQKKHAHRVLDMHDPFAPMKRQNANPNVPGGGRVL